MPAPKSRTEQHLAPPHPHQEQLHLLVCGVPHSVGCWGGGPQSSTGSWGKGLGRALLQGQGALEALCRR